MTRRQANALWPLLGLAASAAYLSIGVLWLRSRHGEGVPSFDTYTYFYPNIAYALRSLREGGGLLWNPYQDCGQPFAAISQTGLLYPVNVVFAFLDREPALIACVTVNLLIGGIGAFALCRVYGLAVSAALCGACCFQLGGTAVMMASWSPMHLGPYVWIPVAMWRLECLLRAPTPANAIWLGVALTLQVLPGFPQTSFFTYQLIVLRTCWEAMASRMRRPFAVLVALACGCLLPLFLAAVQLLPSIELTRESLRGGALHGSDLGISFTWEAIRSALANPLMAPYPGTAVTAAIAMVCGVALCRWRGFNLALFHLSVTVLYACLSLGPNGWLYPWYAVLPLGSAFRMPQRFLWVCGYSLAVLVAFGVDELRRRAAHPSARARSWALIWMLPGAALFFVAVRRAPTAYEWASMAALVVAGGFIVWRVHCALPVFIVTAVVIVNLILASRLVFLGLAPGDIYNTNANAFVALRARLTPQDRVMIVGKHADLGMLPKSAALFRVPSIYDYEPQVSRAYAEYFTFLRTNAAMQSINEWYYPLTGALPKTFVPRLFNLTAARYVLAGAGTERDFGRAPSWRIVERGKRWAIFENPDALPRARFVPRIEVTAADAVLPKLAADGVPLDRVALLVASPRSGFLGSDPDATGTASVLENRAERVVVQVDATARGFLLLADQFAPGWEARVNGKPAELMRANHAFRLVEVPAGHSEVEFRYRPRSVYIGAVISLATLVALLGWAVRRAS